TQWEQNHPYNPMGATCDAAGLLFSEFHRLGVLEGQFLVDDKKFENRPKLNPDPNVRARFDAEIGKAQLAARARLGKNPKDRDALFAMTLTNGLQADYAALIEKRNVASLHYTKESTIWAEQTLAADPDCYDAHIAGGISKYLIGSMAAPVRWLVRLGGLSGDKQAGVKELKLVADRGHYLAPFANILLAVAYVRENSLPQANAAGVDCPVLRGIAQCRRRSRTHASRKLQVCYRFAPYAEPSRTRPRRRPLDGEGFPRKPPRQRFCPFRFQADRATDADRMKLDILPLRHPNARHRD